MLSMTGSNVLSQLPMFHTHCAGSSPLIRVRVNATFLYGELYPAMSVFRQKYPLTSSMKSSALDWSLLKIWGRLPIAFTSAATWTGCWGTWGCPPLLGCPGPPPPPPSPGGPDPPPLPGGLGTFHFTFCIALAILCCRVGAGLKADVLVVVIVAVVVCVVMAAELAVGRLLIEVNGLVHNVGSIGVCLIYWSTVSSPVISSCSSSLSSLSALLWSWSLLKSPLV